VPKFVPERYIFAKAGHHIPANRPKNGVAIEINNGETLISIEKQSDAMKHL